MRRGTEILLKLDDLAAIEYAGSAGITAHCLDALFRLVHYGDRILTARIVSCAHMHGFILDINYGVRIAVKAGFASGYAGEGAGGLSLAIQLLERHGAEIDEYVVPESFLRRLDHSCLLQSDLDELESAQPVRPMMWHDYIRWRDEDVFDLDVMRERANEKLRQRFPVAIPFALIDRRIVDLALRYGDDPDRAIISAFRRLEDIVRGRLGSTDEYGAKLFSKAFHGERSPLYWEGTPLAEQAGRANLFSGAYTAFRNRRAHKEPEEHAPNDMREFLLVNELFALEAEAVERPLPEGDSDEANAPGRE